MNAPADIHVLYPDTPPHSIEAEQSVLGAILMNNQAFSLVSGSLRADHFYEPLHRTIYDAIERQLTAGRVATPVTLRAVLPWEVDVAGITLGQYIARVSAAATTVVNAPDYARLVTQLATMRSMINVGQKLSRARNVTFSPEDALTDAWDELDALRADSTVNLSERGAIGGFAERVVETAAGLKAGVAADVPSTGFADMDKVLGGGYRAGRLVVGAGRPGMGKTVLAIASARRVARQGYGVAFFSLEIDADEVSARILAAELAGGFQALAYRDILSGNLEEISLDRVKDAAARMKEWPLHIDASGGLTMFEIEARARVVIERWAKQGVKPGLIVVDYMGLVTPNERDRGRKVDELGGIALAGKNMSKRLGCCVLLLSQLNRAVESRDDKRPTMADLRDSGNIEEHADAVLLLYRRNYYDQRDRKVISGDAAAMQAAHEHQHDLEAIIGKNRLGPTTIVKLYCDVAASCVDNARHF